MTSQQQSFKFYENLPRIRLESGQKTSAIENVAFKRLC